MAQSRRSSWRASSATSRAGPARRVMGARVMGANGSRVRPKPTQPELWVCHLATVDYRKALALQERIRSARQQDLVPDVMLTLEHWPVYTRGRRSAAGELPMDEEWYLAQGIEIVQTYRGGKVTYHGPGQLVGYP